MGCSVYVILVPACLFIFTLNGIFKHLFENFIMSSVFTSFPLSSPLQLYPMSPFQIHDFFFDGYCYISLYIYTYVNTTCWIHLVLLTFFLNTCWFHENLSAWRKGIETENCHLVYRMPQLLEWVRLATIFHCVNLCFSGSFRQRVRVFGFFVDKPRGEIERGPVSLCALESVDLVSL